jgi:hypothetical protein
MDLPLPTAISPLQYDATDDVAVCIGRVRLGQDVLVRSPTEQLSEHSIKRGVKVQCNSTSYDKGNNNVENPKKKFKTLSETGISKYHHATISPAKLVSPSLSSNYSDRVQRVEIAAIISQASAVAFTMGTSKVEGKMISPQYRRRHHRRNAVVHHL